MSIKRFTDAKTVKQVEAAFGVTQTGAVATAVSGVVALANAAATPPVAGATVAQAVTLAEAQAQAATGRLASGLFARRKTVDVTAAVSGPADWVRLTLTDWSMMQLVQSADDLCVTAADGVTILPMIVRQLPRLADGTYRLADMVVRLPNPQVLATAQRLYVYAGRKQSTYVARPLTTFGAELLAMPAAPLDMAWTCGNGAGGYLSLSGTAESVHPTVLKVPAGSWMKHIADGDGGTVTHILLDTPYPSDAPGVDGKTRAQYENPSLQYSTDDGLTWAEWPGIVNPIEQPPVGSINTDPTMIFLPDGTLRVYTRYGDQGVGTGLSYRDITGTSLTTVTVGERVMCTVTGDEAILSPSIVQISPDLWYMFGVKNVAPGYQWVYRTSTDGGNTWGDMTVFVPRGGEGLIGWWHGEVAGPYDGWYYLVSSEATIAILAATGKPTQFRLFRSRDCLSWEMSSRILMTGGDWCTYPYKASIFETSTGDLAMIFSGFSSAGALPNRIGYALLRDVADVTVTDTVAFGLGLATAADDACPVLAVWDFEDGDSTSAATINQDLCGTYTLTASNAPVHTPGTGYALVRASSQSLQSDFAMGDLGVDWELLLDVTLPATFLADSSQILLGEGGAGTPARCFNVMLLGNTGTLTTYTRQADNTAKSDASATPDLRGVRTRISIQFQSSTQKLRNWVGAVQAAYRNDLAASQAIMDVETGLWIGGHPASLGGTPNVQYADMTIHRLILRQGVTRLRTSSSENKCPVVAWTQGSTAL